MRNEKKLKMDSTNTHKQLETDKGPQICFQV